MSHESSPGNGSLLPGWTVDSRGSQSIAQSAAPILLSSHSFCYFENFSLSTLSAVAASSQPEQDVLLNRTSESRIGSITFKA